jgi:hypothetical protein
VRVSERWPDQRPSSMAGRAIRSGITLTTSQRAIMALVAVVLALLASGCEGGSRSGSDQPGVPAPPGGTSQELSVNEASEDDVAAALRRSDVDDPRRWAQIVVRDGPYAPGDAGEEQLRQVLQRHGADPGEVDKITSVLAP